LDKDKCDEDNAVDLEEDSDDNDVVVYAAEGDNDDVNNENVLPNCIVVVVDDDADDVDDDVVRNVRVATFTVVVFNNDGVIVCDAIDESVANDVNDVNGRI
jgi:hypothetical protein